MLLRCESPLTCLVPHAEWRSLYPYTADLVCLDLCRPSRPRVHPLHHPVCSPLDGGAWAEALRSHPDKAFVCFLLRGFKEGFRIGFHRPAPLQSASRNMLSALQHPEVVREYLEKECSMNRMLGPYSRSEVKDMPPLHINRFGVIPKGHNTGKWRLITDLSHPPGCSVNDGIEPALCSLAKTDVESAYHLIPVHPEDRWLQAVEWQGSYYVDPMLPFGLRSAPTIFNAVADALEWCLRDRGVRHIYHYLDDFTVIGPPRSPVCAEAVDILNRTYAELGVPISEHKRDGPTTCLTYLGIEVDTVASQLRLPQGKLQRLQTLLSEWGDRKVCESRQLESLIGTLNHACKVVRCGRSFLRRMLDLLHRAPAPAVRPYLIRT